MHPRRVAVLLSILVLAACAGHPVRNLSRDAGQIEIVATVAEQVAPRDHRVETATVATAGGVGAAAGLTCGPMAVVCSPVFGLATAAGALADITVRNLLNRNAATRTRALAEGMKESNAPLPFMTDIVSRVQEAQGYAVRGSGPALRLDLAVSRLELEPRFPERVQLLVWVEALLHCAEDACGIAEARQRYVHVGELMELRDLESHPDMLARHLELAQTQLALQIGRDLRR